MQNGASSDDVASRSKTFTSGSDGGRKIVSSAARFKEWFEREKRENGLVDLKFYVKNPSMTPKAPFFREAMLMIDMDANGESEPFVDKYERHSVREFMDSVG